MSDPPEERQRWPLLSDALEICERTVNKVYQAADEEAQHYQRNHKIITALAAVFGTAAVLLAIVQLSSFVPGRWSVPSEFVAALIALFAVILGLVASFQRRYLLERYKAERYRLVKFAFLTDSDLWRANPPPGNHRVDQLSQEVVDIAAMTRGALDVWVVRDDVPNIPRESQTADATRSALVEYYLVKRLNQQITYFAQAGRNIGWQRYTYHLPALCFLPVCSWRSPTSPAPSTSRGEAMDNLLAKPLSRGAAITSPSVNIWTDPRTMALSVSCSSR